jgi:glycosyltransferase 2 family protein
VDEGGEDLVMSALPTPRTVGRPDERLASAGMGRTVRRVVPVIAALATVLLVIGLYLSWRMGRSVAWSRTVLPLLPLMLALGCGSYGARFVRWHLLVRRLAPQLSLRASLRIYMAGFAMGLTPGRVGEFLKFSLLRDATGVAEVESFSIFPVERATEAATFVGLALAGAIYGHLQLHHIGAGSILTMAVLPGLAALALVLRFLYRRSTRGAARTTSSIDTALRGLLTVAGLRALIPALGCAVLARCFDATLFFTASHAVGITLSMAGAAMSWGLAGLVGGLSLLPAGVGAVEASLVATVVGLGGDGATALAAALLARIMTLWLWIPPGLWLAFRSVRQVAPAVAEPAPTASAEQPACAIGGNR